MAGCQVSHDLLVGSARDEALVDVVDQDLVERGARGLADVEVARFGDEAHRDGGIRPATPPVELGDVEESLVQALSKRAPAARRRPPATVVRRSMRVPSQGGRCAGAVQTGPQTRVRLQPRLLPRRPGQDRSR